MEFVIDIQVVKIVKNMKVYRVLNLTIDWFFLLYSPPLPKFIEFKDKCDSLNLKKLKIKYIPPV